MTSASPRSMRLPRVRDPRLDAGSVLPAGSNAMRPGSVSRLSGEARAVARKAGRTPSTCRWRLMRVVFSPCRSRSVVDPPGTLRVVISVRGVTMSAPRTDGAQPRSIPRHQHGPPNIAIVMSTRRPRASPCAPQPRRFIQGSRARAKACVLPSFQWRALRRAAHPRANARRVPAAPKALPAATVTSAKRVSISGRWSALVSAGASPSSSAFDDDACEGARRDDAAYSRS